VRIKAILDSALPESAECTGPSASLISVALKVFRSFSRSDFRHRFIRDFVILI
jgi:hypothetical protein